MRMGRKNIVQEKDTYKNKEAKQLLVFNLMKLDLIKIIKKNLKNFS
jgi:hypothetical protein